jgi:hypothetical protein
MCVERRFWSTARARTGGLKTAGSKKGKMTKTEAEKITGGLSEPSKMPGHAWGINARDCITGSKLHQVKGSVCEFCYALEGRFMWPNVVLSNDRRFARMNDPQWVRAMVELITRSQDDYFRWFHAGDLQSVMHLFNICLVCLELPQVKFWLPTREYRIVAEYRRQYGIIPSNLVIRLSAHMVDGAPPSGFGLPTSTVHYKKKPVGKVCHAPRRANQCGGCRACWNPEIENVSYRRHTLKGKK